jgi:hypothetical protein
MKRNCNSSFIRVIGRDSKDLPYESPQDIVEWQTSWRCLVLTIKQTTARSLCCRQTSNGVDSS